MEIYALHHHILWKVVILFIKEMQKCTHEQCFQYKVKKEKKINIL